MIVNYGVNVHFAAQLFQRCEDCLCMEPEGLGLKWLQFTVCLYWSNLRQMSVFEGWNTHVVLLQQQLDFVNMRGAPWASSAWVQRLWVVASHMFKNRLRWYPESCQLIICWFSLMMKRFVQHFWKNVTQTWLILFVAYAPHLIPTRMFVEIIIKNAHDKI